jgi:hypothetical protein
MRIDGLRARAQRNSNLLIATLIFIVTLTIFWKSPIALVADSKYSMLLSQSLLEHRTFKLDDYALPRLKGIRFGSYYKNGGIYQLELLDGHLYYYMPPGSSVLSLPYVALMNALGVSAANPDGTYNQEGETKIQATLAALLMAALASIFFLTGRLVLPTIWSIVIALGSALGTQVWSTASRALWTHTWGILLLGLVVLMLLWQETGKRKLSPVALASLLSWMYFVRPTSAIFIVAISIYVFLYYRHLFLRYTLTGAVWLAGFTLYSWHYYGRSVPSYYVNRLSFREFWIALPGNLISPSRGLFIFVPVLLFVIYQLVRYRKGIAYPRLLVLALAVIVAHLIVIAGYAPWHAGGIFGARYTTDLVPWFALLAILGTQAMLKWREQHKTEVTIVNWHAPLAAGAFLLLLSVFINGRGAISTDAYRWNIYPINVDKQPSRVWDWGHPQFLAGLQDWPLPADFPRLEGRIDFSKREAEKHLPYGWSAGEGEFRWSDGKKAAFIFTLDRISEGALRMKLVPFLVPGKLDEQVVNLELNGQPIKTLTLREGLPAEYSIALPRELLRQENVLIFGLPGATAPKSAGFNEDTRQLAIGMYWLEIESLSPVSEQARSQAGDKVADRPLPDSGFRATFSVLDPPAMLHRGQEAVVRIKVRNISDVPWPALGEGSDKKKYRVQLGNHWIDSNNIAVVGDDGRTPLPHDLEPGDEVELPLTITAPTAPGEYLLELDMVQEQIAWFEEEGSATARVKVTVR